MTAKSKEVAEVSLHEARRFWYRSSVVPGQPAYKRRAQKNRVAAAEQRRRLGCSIGLVVTLNDYYSIPSTTVHTHTCAPMVATHSGCSFTMFTVFPLIYVELSIQLGCG